MKKRVLLTLIAAAVSTPVLAQPGGFGGGAPQSPANLGKTIFGQQCGLCHSAEQGDNGGAQGPFLGNVFGNEAGVDGRFPYTPALRDSDIVWNEESLDSFLSDPTSVIPGTSMIVPIADDQARANVIAYFEALSNGTFEEPQGGGMGGFGGGGFGGFGGGGEPEIVTDADWLLDEPGRVHRIDLDNLPEPYATESAVNFPSVVERPEDAEIQVPEGFSVEVFTTDVQAPRAMIVAPNGDVFLAETNGNRIKVIRPNADSTAPESIDVFAQGLQGPLGMALYPAGDNPDWLYVAETNRVVRYPYAVGDTVATGVPEVVVTQLSPVGGGHTTRDLAFSNDGTKMYVSVGSQGNVGEGIEEDRPEDLEAWEAERGVGAAYGFEENRAAVMVFEVGNEGEGRMFANGIRNCVGLTVQPETDDVWCAVNERDQIGDELVPDYSTRVPEGGFFGWPWYYMGDYEDPRHVNENGNVRPDLKGKIMRPDVPFAAHSAAVDIEFYVDSDGDSAFPDEYVGDGFTVLHGSWNRADRTGHKVVQVPIVDGEPTGEYIDFLVGFITPTGGTWGRPVAITQMKDGSMLLSDDGANLIYRISYEN